MLGSSKSNRYSGDFVIARFVIARFDSTYFTVILPCRLSKAIKVVRYKGVFVIAGFVKAGCHCIGILLDSRSRLHTR